MAWDGRSSSAMRRFRQAPLWWSSRTKQDRHSSGRESAATAKPDDGPVSSVWHCAGVMSEGSCGSSSIKDRTERHGRSPWLRPAMFGSMKARPRAALADQWLMAISGHGIAREQHIRRHDRTPPSRQCPKQLTIFTRTTRTIREKWQ